MNRPNALPPLEGLRYFEAAARHLNFTRAAGDLYLTQSAVSQKIQSLEDHLGYPLFYRLPRGLRLTSNGERLYISVCQAFGILSETLHQIGDETLQGALKLRTMPSFATRWLIPRLASFNKLHPEIDLQIDADLSMADFKDDGVDLAVTPYWVDNQRLNQQHLFDDLVYPVASPHLLSQLTLTNYQDLTTTHLINDSMPRASYSTNWDAFLARLGHFDLELRGGSGYSRADMVLQAACAGQGIALGRHSLCASDLKAGQLVRPFPDVIQDGQVWLSCPREYLNRPRVSVFAEWLKTEVRQHLEEREHLLAGATIHKLD
ncbi:LysR substrate-binding domain-containing protein [Marinobacter sp.]|uniref:LysR substrate-binding domain-containing protein n=1 Tax=Marinobacter sp. TaxID=50741 RepID=UPI0035658F66